MDATPWRAVKLNGMDSQRKANVAVQRLGLPDDGQAWLFNGLDCPPVARLEIQRLG
jgi:hypothetical protein